MAGVAQRPRATHPPAVGRMTPAEAVDQLCDEAHLSARDADVYLRSGNAALAGRSPLTALSGANEADHATAEAAIRKVVEA